MAEATAALDPVFLCTDGHQALQAGDPMRALALFRQAWLLAPDDPGVPAAISRCLRRLDRHHEADRLLELQLQLTPEALPLLLASIDALVDRGRPQTSLRQLLPLVPQHGDSAQLRAVLGRLATLLLPEVPPQTGDDPGALLQALLPGLPQRLLVLHGLDSAPLAAVAGGLQAPGWRRFGPLPGDWGASTGLQVLATALDDRCRGAEGVLLEDADGVVPVSRWEQLARQRGLDLAVLLLVDHPVVHLQQQRRRGQAADDALAVWLQRHTDAEHQSRRLPRRVLPARQLEQLSTEALARDCRDLLPGWRPAAGGRGGEPVLPPRPLAATAGPPPDPGLLLQALQVHQALIDGTEPPMPQPVASHEAPVRFFYSMTYWGYLHHSLATLAGGLDLPDWCRGPLLDRPRAIQLQHDPELDRGRSTLITPFNLKDLTEDWFLALTPGQRRALAQGRLRLVLDGSNEAGTSEMVQGLIGLLQAQGVQPDPSRLLLVCQNRQLDGAGWFTVLPHDYYVLRAWQSVRDIVTAEQRQQLALRNPLQAPAGLLCLNATPRPLRLATLVALLEQGVWQPEVEPAAHRVSFPGFVYAKQSAPPRPALVALLQAQGFADPEPLLDRLERLAPLRVDGFSETGNELADRIDLRCWRDSRLSLVTETECQPDVRRITEKSFKALALGHPVVVSGNAGSLELLQELGFDVITDQIDPAYDTIDRLGDRSRAAVAVAAEALERLPLSESLQQAVSRGAAANIAWAYDGFQQSYAHRYSQPIVDRLLWRDLPEDAGR